MDNVATSSKQDNYFYPDCSRYRSLPFFCIYKRESPAAHKRFDFPPFLITCGIRRTHGRSRTNRVKICFNGQRLRLRSSSLRVKVPQKWRWLTCLHFHHHKVLRDLQTGRAACKGAVQAPVACTTSSCQPTVSFTLIGTCFNLPWLQSLEKLWSGISKFKWLSMISGRSDVAASRFLGGRPSRTSGQILLYSKGGDAYTSSWLIARMPVTNIQERIFASLSATGCKLCFAFTPNTPQHSCFSVVR